MSYEWLLFIAIAIEAGFIFWYCILVITFARSVFRGENWLTTAMFLLSLGSVFNAIWLVNSLPSLPIENIIAKLPLDAFKIVAVTLFMWELKLKWFWRKWRNR